MIRILYFARLAETLSIRAEELDLPADCNRVDDLVAMLSTRGDPFDSAFGDQAKILVAINQEMSESSAAIRDGDEVAFFPPVTGG